MVKRSSFCPQESCQSYYWGCREARGKGECGLTMRVCDLMMKGCDHLVVKLWQTSLLAHCHNEKLDV
jgi:hypothetical protein